jgi:hypothetical protein
MHALYLLHVSITHVIIVSEMHYEGQVHRNVIEVFEPIYRFDDGPSGRAV